MTDLDSMRDHWWWRPGWRAGRSFHTWHVTFADQPDIHRLAADYAPVLATLPQLDPVPVRWLHLTLQGVGFTDEISPRDVDRIVQAARTRCAVLKPFTVTIGPAHVAPETIQMPARPVESLTQLRLAIRAGIGEVWGHDNVPELETGFRPHVSLGYANATGPAGPLADALDAHDRHAAEITVDSVALINLNRDHKAYEWTDVATVHLGTG